ncbi:septum formation initiator family protein [Cytobacillus spongiae]|jgi:cell division protein DivIC|uniref:FtsB family cell division protein n=1 Tax=Cytobacillus spongiae TaxID=2901381 RepID=UPI001F41C4DD|nr:septum formation initiator family protein [Cytobacillus spongiae]UII56020.1 septum formation initiator family protein [Cytobacillus spongiae]
MSAVRKTNIKKMNNSYVQEQQNIKGFRDRKRALLVRRLTVFFIGAGTIIFFMISTLISQASALEEKEAEKKLLDQELTELKAKQVLLKEDIVRLNDDEYIAKLARKDYFLSEKNEIIFNIPKEEDKEK